MSRLLLLQTDRAAPETVAAELLHGLQSQPATIPPKYFYDALGSRLFAAITELPEYYLTRTEAMIVADHADAMARHLPPMGTLVDLGAGNCEKAARLFLPFGIRRYVAVDISADYLRDSLELLQRQHPAMELLGVGTDFSRHLELPAAAGAGPRLMFHPGSSIGNLAPDAALAFLRQVHGASQGGGLLIGVDLLKSAEVLEAAYDDALGVTAAFNRNVLLHLNRLIGTNFRLGDWRHVAVFNAAESRIEMHLEALRDLTLQWPQDSRRFAAGERIHTENSYKWAAADFAALLQHAGFSNIRHWSDPADHFAVFLAAA